MGVLADHLGVNQTAAAMLLLLYDAGGEPLSRLDLALSTSSGRSGVRVRISELRTILSDETIDTPPHRGYTLTPKGILEVRRVINDAVIALLSDRPRPISSLRAIDLTVGRAT